MKKSELNTLRIVQNKKERPVELLLGGHGTGASVITAGYRKRSTNKNGVLTNETSRTK